MATLRNRADHIYFHAIVMVAVWTQKSRQKSPSGHHPTTLSGCIFETKARIDSRKKNLLSSDMSSTCPHNMVNLRPTNG